MLKTINLVADRRIAKERQVFEAQLGQLANRAEKAELLATHGADKAKYIPAIEQRQRQHWQQTGTYMPAATALDLIRSGEKDQRIAELEAKLAAGNGGQAAPQVQETAPAATHASGGPQAAGTRERPGASAPRAPSPANANFSDLSVEEMEARLETQFKSGTTL